MIRRRLGEIDPIDELSTLFPPLVLQVCFGTLCFAAAYLMRELIVIFTPGAGPFSLIFPAILFSTLYGRWPAGLVTFAFAFLHTWYFVLPFQHSFAFEVPGDGARAMVNGLAALFILFFAEVFRSSVRMASNDRDRELKNQEDLMQELEHRTKNNFAMVSSLLTMQQRKTNSQDAKRALLTAATRVQSFAAIHETIYTSKKFTADIPLDAYLHPLIRQLEVGLFRDRPIRIELVCPPDAVSRERALAFGLIVNELVTNAAKHAFPNERGGTITVTYEETPATPWRLSIRDDGCGIGKVLPDQAGTGSGLGQALLSSFAIMAGGTIQKEPSEAGMCISIIENGF